MSLVPIVGSADMGHILLHVSHIYVDVWPPNIKVCQGLHGPNAWMPPETSVTVSY